MSEHWFALHTRSRFEKAVSEQLRAKQQNVFLPLYTSKRKWADRWKTVSMPLFSGYVFCRFNPLMRSTVMATTGVIDVVRNGRDPAPIEDNIIDALQTVVSSPLLTEPYAGIVPGERIVMTGGPLVGLQGSVVEIKNTLRFVISVDLLHRSVLVEIDKDWVAPLRSAQSVYGTAVSRAIASAS